MDIEELAFKDRKTLAQLNEKDLLDIIVFLQSDRKLWINQFSKTHNESVDIRKENQELKKQLEEWKHHLKCSKEMLDIQGQKGNYDYDEYMLGLYNGMEHIIALFETREPNYTSGKDVEFTNNETQQKELKQKYLNAVADYETTMAENQVLKKDINNIIRILEKNCDDLEATEEEFDSLDRWQGLQVVELEQGSSSND